MPTVPLPGRPGGQPRHRGLQRFPRSAPRLGLHVLRHGGPHHGPGRRRPPAIAGAIAALAARGPGELDVVVLVRGGGSKSDLAAFDAEAVARAVATCPLPVWTGIGHTGDESVADLVANRRCITPTECGQRAGPAGGPVVGGPGSRAVRRPAAPGRRGSGGRRPARPRGPGPPGRDDPAPALGPGRPPARPGAGHRPPRPAGGRRRPVAGGRARLAPRAALARPPWARRRSPGRLAPAPERLRH